MLLFSTDIDGTIYDGPDSARTFSDFWNGLRSRPSPPLLAYNTGRSIDDTLKLISETHLPSPDYLIGGVGTEILHPETGQLLEDWTATLRSGWDVAKVESLVADEAEEIEQQPEECQNPFKSSWFWHGKTRQDIDRLQGRLDREGLEAQVVYSSARDLDVLPLKANKGNAIAWLAESLGVDLDRVAVAGDSGNDASMFLVDDVYGIIVSNAESSLPASVSGARIFHSARPCVEGVIEGLTRLLVS